MKEHSSLVYKSLIEAFKQFVISFKDIKEYDFSDII